MIDHKVVESEPNEGKEAYAVGLLDLLIELGREKRVLLGLPLLAAICSVVVSLMLPVKFSSMITLLPPSKSSTGPIGSLLGDSGGLAALSGLGSSGVESYVTLLKSKSAKDLAAKKFDLVKRYGLNIYEDVYAQIDDFIRVDFDKKNNLVKVEVLDPDPLFAAKLANGYFEILVELQDRLAVTEAQRKRVFFEKQLIEAKNSLSDAEVKLANVQSRTGVFEIGQQAAATLEAIAGIRAQIAAKEVTLASYQSFATQENPEYKRVQAELLSLRAQLKRLESRSVDGQKGGSAFASVSAEDLPKQGLEYVRAFREVKYRQTIFEIMAKQFEMAKLDEAKEGAGVQLLDEARPAEHKSSPKRVIIVLVSVFSAGFLALLIALTRCWIRVVRSRDGGRFGILKKAWGF